MSLMPRITVYIASRNYGRFLGEAIESVLRQTVDDWELLLIDDGSTDDTSQVMDLYRGQPRITIHRTDGIGLPAVSNLALREAKGDYIIRLDGDDFFDENILLILGSYLDRDGELALVFPDYYLVDEGGEIFAHERRRKLYSNDHLMDVPPNGACTMVRCKVLRELGGYREDLGAQDGLDLWVKLKDQHKTTNISLPLFNYRRHGQNMTEQPLRIVNARRELKKDATLKHLDLMRPVIAIIPCRRNYDFVPDLWDQVLAGRSLLERDIETCLGSSIIDKVVVTCDNHAAEDTVRSFSNPRVIFVARDERSTLLSSNIVDTLKEVVRKVDPEGCGTTVMRYVQTPFISTGTIEEAITSLAVSSADSACAIEELRSRIYRRTAFGLMPINENHGLLVGSETLYRDASTCIALRNANLRKGSLTGSSLAGFVVSAAESFFISSAHDLEVARALVIRSKAEVGS